MWADMDPEAAIYLVLVLAEALVIVWLTWTIAADSVRKGRHQR